MNNNSPVTQFLNMHLSVECRIDYYTLGQHPSRILDNVTQDESWTSTDTCRLLQAVAWTQPPSEPRHAGPLANGIVIAEQGYAAGTPVVFNGCSPGGPFALIVRPDFTGDWRTFTDSLR